MNSPGVNFILFLSPLSELDWRSAIKYSTIDRKHIYLGLQGLSLRRGGGYSFSN